MSFSIFSLSSKIKAKIVIYVDTGLLGVRGALVVPDENGGRIVSVVKTGEKFSEIKGISLDHIKASIDKVSLELKLTIETERKKGVFYSVEDIHCVLGAPLYLSHTRLVNVSLPKPEKISSKILASIINEARTKDLPFKDSIIIADRISDILLNDYVTSNPYNKVASSISLSLFTAALDKKVHSLIISRLSRYFDVPVTVDTSAFVFSTMLKNSLPLNKDFLIVLIGGETTEITMVKDSKLSETLSIPRGFQSTLVALGKRLKETPHSVHSAISLRDKGKLGESAEVKLNAALLEERSSWFSLFQDALLPISEETSIPERILLIAPKEARALYVEFLSMESFITKSLAQGHFSVSAILGESLSNYPHFSSSEDDDPIIGISTMFALSPKEKIVHTISEKSFMVQSKT